MLALVLSCKTANLRRVGCSRGVSRESWEIGRKIKPTPPPPSRPPRRGDTRYTLLLDVPIIIESLEELEQTTTCRRTPPEVHDQIIPRVYHTPIHMYLAGGSGIRYAR